jgi:hypothetical protein
MSWPELARLYDLYDFDGRYAYLKRRAVPAAVTMRPLITEQRHLGETFQVPDIGAPLFAQLEIRPTLLGTIAKLALKTSQLEITLTTSDGQSRHYRIISGMAATGFVLSPLVMSTREFAYFASGNIWGLVSHRVTSMTIESDIPQLPLWASDFEIRLSAIERVGQVPLPAELAASK